MRAAKEGKVTDKDLVEQVKKGSIAAFEELMSRYETKAFNLAIKFTKNEQDAEEVLQDAFISVYKKIDSFQGKSAFSSWLYRIVVNAAFMKLRKKKQQQAIAIEDLTPSVKKEYLDKETYFSYQSDYYCRNRELTGKLQAAIKELPEQYRTVFILRDIDGLSNQEAGNILEISTPAVKSRLHRARIMLRKSLQGYWNEHTGMTASMEEVRAAA